MLKIFVLISIMVVAPPAMAEMHTWQDAAGVRHFSNVQVRGRALPEIEFDPAAHRERLDAEARQRALDIRAEALAAERMAAIQAMRPPPAPPARVTVVNNTVEIRPVYRYRQRYRDKYWTGIRSQWEPRRPCRPRPRSAEHIPYYKRHLVYPKLK